MVTQNSRRRDVIEKLEPLVVTGIFLPTSLNQKIASSTTIERKQVEASQALSVTELSVAAGSGFAHRPAGRMWGGVSSVFLSGGDPNFTMVANEVKELANQTAKATKVPWKAKKRQRDYPRW